MELALCLSGGGYRAALYHLGVLSFLNELNLTDGTVMLDHIRTITSISGGALTGMRYVISEADNLDRVQTFKSLYHEIVNTNIGGRLIERFDRDSRQNKGAIQTLAGIYNDYFFHDENFGKILNSMSWDGIHHFYADATDFELGIPFRFQATAKLQADGRTEEYGMIGNWQHRLDRDVAMNIRLADIMAATSCFPLVFEPIICPRDFHFANNLRYKFSLAYPLMDGGLIDNQGIEPAIHASEQMKKEGREMDMMIICDAANGGEEDEDKSLSLLDTTPGLLFVTLLIMSIFCFVLCYWSYDAGIYFGSGVFLMLGLSFVAVGQLLRWVNRKVCSFLSKKTKLHFKKETIWNNTFSNIGTFVKARALTAYRMTDAIMTGHMKKLWFRLINEKKEWELKIVNNQLGMFSTEKTWKDISDEKGLTRFFRPERDMRQLAEKASKMNTTLWFTEKDIEDGVPEAIFACGRFTTCWSLLVYVDELNTIQNPTPFQAKMAEQEDVLSTFWRNFKIDPLYNISAYTS